MRPSLSDHFASNVPSAIRVAQELYLKRSNKPIAINAAIGNVSLPMHPAMQKRMFNLKAKGSPFAAGSLQYTQTRGTNEANEAMKNILQASEIDTSKLYTQITDGGSAAMELVILGVANKGENILMIDPSYTNYHSMAKRTSRQIVTVSRKLLDNGKFELPNTAKLEKIIQKYKPKAMILIPYDNPTGQLMSMESMNDMMKLAVKYNMWIISDEAYRELHYSPFKPVSIWSIDKNLKGIQNRRINIESASKVWNACGLRIGAIVSDNEEFIEKSVAENTANLCPNAIGQYIFGALAHESKAQLNKWFDKQRSYYKQMIVDLNIALTKSLPGIIVSKPEAALYSVVDFRNLVNKNFDTGDFAKFAASKGNVEIGNKKYTLLFSPMKGFYGNSGKSNPGRTQIRLCFVEPPECVKLIPSLLTQIFKDFLGK